MIVDYHCRNLFFNELTFVTTFESTATCLNLKILYYFIIITIIIHIFMLWSIKLLLCLKCICRSCYCFIFVAGSSPRMGFFLRVFFLLRYAFCSMFVCVYFECWFQDLKFEYCHLMSVHYIHTYTFNVNTPRSYIHI